MLNTLNVLISLLFLYMYLLNLSIFIIFYIFVSQYRPLNKQINVISIYNSIFLALSACDQLAKLLKALETLLGLQTGLYAVWLGWRILVAWVTALKVSAATADSIHANELCGNFGFHSFAEIAYTPRTPAGRRQRNTLNSSGAAAEPAWSAYYAAYNCNYNYNYNYNWKRHAPSPSPHLLAGMGIGGWRWRWRRRRRRGN